MLWNQATLTIEALQYHLIGCATLVAVSILRGEHLASRFVFVCQPYFFNFFLWVIKEHSDLNSAIHGWLWTHTVTLYLGCLCRMAVQCYGHCKFDVLNFYYTILILSFCVLCYSVMSHVVMMLPQQILLYQIRYPWERKDWRQVGICCCSEMVCARFCFVVQYLN